ncbi:helix-turn-helix domain-containing protein [Autumnicola edwardsiae]|uniref:AraC family transcriptional regulator n=1 Tax=Autumnicola edwardsiae TaxID=3075594 RepID=A0ABU3CZ36_9FLAO|nr:AraC family transcriptional regulator [Zunongwangia sp. F297]MDT0651636.1 AraC family transcriptional regulator [Zunongwangia sp. F297]
MKTLDLRSMSASHVIHDLAEALNVKFEKKCEEYTLHLPPKVGSGFITGIDTEGGLGVLLYDCTFKQDTQVCFSVNEVHPLKFLYVLEGFIEHHFQDDKEDGHHIEKYQTAIVASESETGHILNFKADEHTRIHSLEINRKIFSEKRGCELKNLKGDLKALFEDVEAKKKFYYRDHLSLDLANLFKKMYDFGEVDYLRKIYLEGVAYQILIKQIILYLDSQEDGDRSRLLRTSEVEQVQRAVDYIEEQIAESPGVEEIAKEVGLNVNKLQYGFKMLFDSTVNKFIHKTRLDIARNLLLHTDFNVSEVANSVGLSNKSYFSKVFKESYKITPSEFQQKNKARRKDSLSDSNA